MDQRRDAVDHREYEALIAAAALGALTREEHAALAGHLPGCASCREAYGRLLSVADALPLAVEEMAPPPALRERLRAQVERDARARPHQSAPPILPLPVASSPAPAARLLSWPARIAAVAAILLVGLLGGIAVDRLLLDDGAGERELALQYPTDLRVGDASLAYLPEEGLLRFTASDLPAPPEGRVYQVWLIGGEGDAPAPVGTIDPESGAFATAVDPDRYGTFAVTVEPGPIGSAAPTSDPVIVAQIR